MIALLLALGAQAADGPTIHGQTRLATAGWPTGAISDTRVELRTPLHRSESIVFQDTFAGAGVRVAATPAFTEVGPQVTLAPIDVFDLRLAASWSGYYGTGGIGLMPFDAPRNKLGSERSDRADEGLQGGAFSLTAAPTLKAKVGPVVAVHGWTASYLVIAPDAPHAAPFVYEPYRDLVVGWNDWAFEHQTAVLYEALPGGEEPLLRVGLTARDRFALASGDRSTTAGLLLMGKPSASEAVPTLVSQVLWYATDADRVGPVPSVALMAQWSLERPVR